MSHWYRALFFVSAFLFASLCSVGSLRAQEGQGVQALSSREKDLLRSRLERIYYEQDLMIRNQKVDRSDVKHQEQEFNALKVFERIPFREDIAGLRASLEQSSQEQGLKLGRFKLRPKTSKKPSAIPSKMYSDENPNFKLTNEQLAESIPFEAVVQGNLDAVRAWIHSWPEDQMRIAVAEEPSPRPLGENRWEIHAHAFKFRETRFPTLEPREPLEVLPNWARRHPDRFAQAEPVLWSYVERTHAISSQARPLFELREQMLLNSARMSFFVAQAAPRGN